MTFLPGETCVSVTVPINDDSIPEKTESFVAVLMTSDATPDHVSIGTPSTAVGLITDNDPLGKHTYVPKCSQLGSVNACIYVSQWNLIIHFKVILVAITTYSYPVC